MVKCDFLNVEICETRKSVKLPRNELSVLPAEYFDTVIFSLLLTYLPQPWMRYRVAVNAYKTLKTGGLLVIVDPQVRDAETLRLWKVVLGQIGFHKVIRTDSNLLFVLSQVLN